MTFSSQNNDPDGGVCGVCKKGPPNEGTPIEGTVQIFKHKRNIASLKKKKISTFFSHVSIKCISLPNYGP